MEEWFFTRDSDQHRQNALGWRRCKSDASRKRFVQETGMRWSDLLRLLYFDPIRFVTVDPMHCLFLGIAKWIVKRLWVDEGVLTSSDLKKTQTIINQFQVPSDLDRVPGKIHAGEGFSNFTVEHSSQFMLWLYFGSTFWPKIEKSLPIL